MSATSSRGGLPAAVWILPGLLAGFLLGGIPPRAELAEVQAEVQKLKDEQVREMRRAARRSPLSVVGLDRTGMGAETERREEEPYDGPIPEGSMPVVTEAPGPKGDDTGGVAAVTDPPSMAEEFELAVEAQRIRRDQSRAALIEQADLDAAEVARLDEIAATMNERLGAMGDDLLAMMNDVNAAEEPDTTELLGLTHEVTGVLYDAQSALDELVGDSAEVDRTASEVWNLVDLESFRGAVEAAEQGGRGR